MSSPGNNRGPVTTLKAFAGLLAVAALGQLIVAMISMGDTSGIFNGGIWTGVICLLLCSTILNQRNSLRGYQCLTFSCLLAFISSCISTAFLNSQKSLMKNLEVCGHDCSDNTLPYCSKFSGSDTQENKGYANFCFSEVVGSYNCNCYVNPAYLNADDDYNTKNSINCQYFDLQNCNVLFTKLPNLISTSYGFSLSCLILSFILLVISCSIVYVPQYRDSIIIVESSASNLQQPIYLVNAGNATYAQSTPVYVTATTSNPYYANQEGQNIVVVEPYVQTTAQPQKETRVYGY